MSRFKGRITGTTPPTVSGGGGVITPTGGAQGGWLESLKTALGTADTLATTSDAATFAVANRYGETNVAATEAVKVGVPSGLADTNVAPADSRTSSVTTWATTQTTAGTAPVNPTNALFDKNGTLATVKAGGVANGTSTITNTIPVTAVPAAGTKTLRAYYRTVPGTSGDTFTLTYANTGGVPASGVLLPGDFLTIPAEVAISTVGSSFTVAFTHAATVIAAGGQIDVDATGILVTGAF